MVGFWIICWILFGVLNIFIASQKNIHTLLGFLLGFLLGVIGTIILLCLPRNLGNDNLNKNRQAQNEYENVCICSVCSYQIFENQKYCPNCGSPSPLIVNDFLSEIDKIYKLKTEGKITEEEYEKIKQVLLSKITPKGDTNV